MTILAADLAADCLSAIPLKAPSRSRRRIPSSVEAVTETLGERRIRGKRSTKDENMEVAEIIVPEKNALLLIRASIRRTWGWSIPRAGRVFPFRFRFVLSSASRSRPFFSVVCERYVAANAESDPATAPPRAVVNICWGWRSAEPAAEIIPRIASMPSMEPKTSSADRLPDSCATSSVL